MSGIRVGIFISLCLAVGGSSPAEEYELTSSSALIVSGGLSLRWVSPGDDGNTGTAFSYDLRYAITPLSSTTWPTASVALSEPAPIRAGTTQSCFVTRLIPGRTYYFAIKASDDAGNWSGMSKVLAKTPQAYFVGDNNSDLRLDVSDCSYLINYVFQSGREPKPWGAGDTNCDGTVTVADIVYLVKYIFQSGQVPGMNCPQ